MGNCNFKQTICDANASGREHSFAPQNIYCNALFNSKEVQNVEGGQNGRSMIEMLGVLAIIGVLSVGGIAGYSKVMMKYRINKTIEQISMISTNIRTFWGSQKDYTGISASVWNLPTNYTIIQKAKLVPEEMWITTDGKLTSLTNSFGGDVQIYGADVVGAEEEAMNGFELYYGGLPTEACIELATLNWGNVAGSGLVAIAVGGYLDGSSIGCNGAEYNNDGIVACPNGSVVSIPMPIDKAADYCAMCGDSCWFGLAYR